MGCSFDGFLLVIFGNLAEARRPHRQNCITTRYKPTEETNTYFYEVDNEATCCAMRIIQTAGGGFFCMFSPDQCLALVDRK